MSMHYAKKPFILDLPGGTMAGVITQAHRARPAFELLLGRELEPGEEIRQASLKPFKGLSEEIRSDIAVYIAGPAVQDGAK